MHRYRTGFIVAALASASLLTGTEPPDAEESARYEAVFRTLIRLSEPASGTNVPRMPKAVYERYWQNHVGITSIELAELEKVAVSFKSAVTPIDRRISELKDEAHQILAKTSKVPAMPNEINELRNRKIEVLLSHRWMLRQRLGAESFLRADAAFRNWLNGAKITKP